MKLSPKLQEAQKRYGIIEFKGVIGSDTSGNPDVAGWPGYVYVQLRQADSLSAPIPARWQAVCAKNVGQPIDIGYDRSGNLCVLRADFDGQVANGINPLSNNPADKNVSTFVNQSQITTLLSHVVSSASDSMLVTVEPYVYIKDGVIHWFLGGNGDGSTPIDLTSYIPADAATQCMAGLFLKDDDTIEVQVSSNIPGSDPLWINEAQECLDASSANSSFIWAYHLYYGQTTIIDGTKDVGGDTVLDFRQIVTLWGGTGGGGMTSFNVAADGGTPATIGDGDTVTLAGGAGITTSISGDTVTIDLDATPAPSDAHYVTTQAESGLSAEFNLGGLSSGLLKQAVSAGVATPAIATAETDYVTPSGAGTLTNKILTSPVINTGVSGTAIDTDGTLAANSDTLLASQKATKTYVDQVASGLVTKADVRLATAVALPTVVYANGSSGVGATLTAFATGVLTIDGVAVALNDRLLIKDQVAQLQNGIYKCTVAGAIGVLFVLTRTTDGDTDAELRGAWMFATEGTDNADQGFINTNTSAITFGTTAITFGEFSAGAIVAGTGLSKSGNTLSLQTPVALANGGTHADLSATGGAGQFLKQSSAGANVSVGAIGSGDLTAALVSPPDVGTTTPAAGYFSALREKIGGFFAIFTHANSADRTYTLPNASGTIALTSDIGTPVTSVTASSPLASSGGTTPDISLSSPVTQAYLADYWRQPVQTASTSNVNIASPGATIGGYSVASGDRILLTAQSTSSQNGLWVFNGSSSPLTRPVDYLSGSATLATLWLFVWVLQGSNSGSIYRLTTTGAITIDTTGTAWSVVGLQPASGGTGIQNWATGKLLVGGVTGGPTVITVGTDGQVLTANSAASPGVDWETPAILVLSANNILGADTANFDLTSLSGSYNHLKLLLKLRSDKAATTNENVYIRFNNDSTAANYYSYAISESGTTPTLTPLQRLGATGTGCEIQGGCTAATATAGYFTYLEVTILNYAVTATPRQYFYTGYFQIGNSTGNLINIRGGGLWTNTSAAISRITVLPVSAGNFKTNSSCELLAVA